MKKWSKEDIEMLKGLFLENTNKEIGVVMNRSSRSIERMLSKLKWYRLEKIKEKIFCRKCENEITGSGIIFCSKSCSASYNNKKRDREIYEKISKKLKSKNKNKLKIKSCGYCSVVFSSSDRGKICGNCKKWYRNVDLYKKIKVFKKGVSLEDINSIAIDVLSDLYYNKGYSKPDLKEEFGLDTKTIYNYFKKNGLKLRDISDALSNAILKGKAKIPCSNMYKSGWHVTWENKRVFYRSSYELGYAKYLDKKSIPYDMEFKRFVYYNTNENKNRIAIPDFYLPLENKIVEIKSKYTYDEIEMNDKKKKYIYLGYDFELLFKKDLKKLGIDIQ